MSSTFIKLPATGAVGSINYISTWNAATNSPTIVSGVGTKGDYYVVSVAGSTNIDGNTSWDVGDWIVFNGTVWNEVDNATAVSSVFGRVGAVVAATNDYTFAQIDKTTSSLADLTTRSAADLSSGTLPDARIQSSGVTQHEGDIDHNALTNTHNLTTDIDHNSLTNTHNLTTDIDHDQLTNYTATEHFTMIDDDSFATASDTTAATSESIKAYVDALGCNPANTFTVSSSGGDYTTIQAALTANATANTLFIVYPGTYTNDTINFTANAQTVMTPSKGNNVIVTNSAQVVEVEDFTGCKIKNIRINFTPTTAINGIEVNDGSLSLDSCRLDLTTSSAIAGSAQPALVAVTGTGTLTAKFGEYTYQHTGNTTNGIKAMFNVATGGTIDCLRLCASSMTNSGTAAATSLGIDAGTGELRITEACELIITDTAAAIVAGLGYIGGSGDNEFQYCKIKVIGGGSNTCYGIYNGGTGTVRSTHNIIEVVSGTANYSFFTGAGAETISQMDDIRAENNDNSTGTYTCVNSPADGYLCLTGDVGSTADRVTKGWFTDLEVTNAIAGSITGNAATVSTITGLAPDTATTAAAQANITSLGTLTGLGVSGTSDLDGAVTINETGADVDFRVEGSGAANALFVQGSDGNVGIGTDSPNANAILDVSSTTKAFMPPRMTTTQKGNVANPTAGMVVYDSTLGKLCVYTGSAWETITSA